MLRVITLILLSSYLVDSIPIPQNDTDNKSKVDDGDIIIITCMVIIGILIITGCIMEYCINRKATNRQKTLNNAYRYWEMNSLSAHIS